MIRVKVLKAQSLWLEELKVRGCSTATLSVYEIHTNEAIKSIADFLELSKTDLLLDEISRDSIVSALSVYRNRPDKRTGLVKERSGVSVERHLAAIKSFLSWCVETEKVTRNVASQVKTPKSSQRIPKALPVESCKQLLETARKSQWKERDVLLLLCGMTLGLRLGEITSLTTESFSPNINNPTHVTVIGKGSKERTIPTPSAFKMALKDYLVTRETKLTKVDLETKSLFLSRNVYVTKNGKQINATHDGLGQVFERLLEKAGLKKPGLRAHMARHSFAAIALSSRAFDLEELRMTLGHSSIATTQGYLRVDPERLSAASEAHPLSGLS